MAIQAKLRINGDDKDYNILECVYDFRQTVDDTGKPVSRPQGGTITFVTPTTSDEDLFFYKWMFNKTEVQSGVFVFTIEYNDNKECYKTLEFKNAYCIELKDYFNNTDSKLMYSTITISAQVITIGKKKSVVSRGSGSGNSSFDQAKFTNEWT